MTAITGLDNAELARQLRDPEGAAGLAVIAGLAAANAEGCALALERLDIGNRAAVLELGCGLGDLAGVVGDAGEGVRYVGLDRSETMIRAACERHGEAIRSGTAAFHLGTSEALPFGAHAFDHVFSIGLIHFWAEPLASLGEVRRVLRKNWRMVMACLGLDRAPAFATAENGFLLRSADEWDRLCRGAGFASCQVELFAAPERPQALLVSAAV